MFVSCGGTFVPHVLLLINAIRGKPKVIAINSGMLHESLFYNIHKQNKFSARLSPLWYLNFNEKVRKFLNFFLAFIKKNIKIFNSKVNKFIFFIFRYIFRIQKYKQTNYFNTISGIEDCYLVYDDFEKKHVSKLDSNLRIFKFRHPLFNEKLICKPANNLFILLGGPIFKKISEEKLFNWTQIVFYLIKQFSIESVSVRFHPRETTTFKDQLREHLSEFQIKFVDCTIKADFKTNVENSSVVLGCTSGSLRISRFINPQIPVIGLIDGVINGFWGKPTALSGTPGILWVNDVNDLAENLTKFDFTSWVDEYIKLPSAEELISKSFQDTINAI